MRAFSRRDLHSPRTDCPPCVASAQGALRETGDDDARFLFLWIALNAAYAREFGFEQSERDQARQFIDRLIVHDREGRLQQILFDRFTGPVRTLLENRFVYEPFWRALRDHDASNTWEVQFANARKLAMRALMARKTDVVLSIVADRLYVLRNQLMHGGATWNSDANRQQVRDAVAILGALMPVIIDLMIEHPEPDESGITFPLLDAPRKIPKCAGANATGDVKHEKAPVGEGRGLPGSPRS